MAKCGYGCIEYMMGPRRQLAVPSHLRRSWQTWTLTESRMTELDIEKRPGRDWCVTYRWEDEEEIEVMMGFGASDEAAAFEDAH